MAYGSVLIHVGLRAFQLREGDGAGKIGSVCLLRERGMAKRGGEGYSLFVLP